MVNMSAVLVANGLGAGLMLVLMLSSHTVPRTVFLDDRIFSAMCRLTFCLCVLETASFWVDGKLFVGAEALSRVLNVLLFIANSSFSFLWPLYVDCKLFEKTDRLRRYYPLLAIPALAVCLLAAANLFTDVFFTISDGNIYARTPLFVLSYLVTYGYLLFGAAMVLRYQNRVGKYLIMPVLLFLLPIFVGSLLQLCFYGIALIWVSVAFGLVSLYISLQNEASLLDPLTKLYNREYLNRFLNGSFQKGLAGRQMVGIMMDINSFKEINDTYGHSEGDAALKMVGRCLLDTVPGDAVAVRYGGDEFIVLAGVRSERETDGLMERIRARLELANDQDARPYRITLSMGAAPFYPGEDDLDLFLGRMDRNMYEAKRAYYSGANGRRAGERRRQRAAQPSGAGE